MDYPTMSKLLTKCVKAGFDTYTNDGNLTTPAVKANVRQAHIGCVFNHLLA